MAGIDPGGILGDLRNPRAVTSKTPPGFGPASSIRHALEEEPTMKHVIMFSTVATLTLAATTAGAIVVPFTEDFDTDSANWFNAAETGPVDWSAVGGPDGGAYATTGFNFQFSNLADRPALFRGHDALNSSGDGFVGDWITSGVTEFSFTVRHDAPLPLPFFARFAPNFAPGANAVAFAPVLPNVWTTITVPINPGAFFIYEGTDFASTFSNVGRVQIGIEVPAGLNGLDQLVTFDLDKPTIVPAPPVAGLFALGGLAATTRRRRS